MKLKLNAEKMKVLVRALSDYFMHTGSPYECVLTEQIVNAVVARLLKKWVDQKSAYKITLSDTEALAIHRALGCVAYTHALDAAIGNEILAQLDQYVHSRFDL